MDKFIDTIILMLLIMAAQSGLIICIAQIGVFWFFCSIFATITNVILFYVLLEMITKEDADD